MSDPLPGHKIVHAPPDPNRGFDGQVNVPEPDPLQEARRYARQVRSGFVFSAENLARFIEALAQRVEDAEAAWQKGGQVSKTVEVLVSVRKNVPQCCRATLLKFAAGDRYLGAGEPGDQIKCPCGNWLVYGPPGWGLRQEGE